jgi:sporulation protein YlmC with PRC-barrel domain
VDLIRDVLDTAVVDRQGRELGRVDGVVIEAVPGAPPRVAAIEIGPDVLAARLNPLLGRLVAAVETALRIGAGRPVRIPFRDVIDVGTQITVDCVWSESPATIIERRLRRWLRALPGGS